MWKTFPLVTYHRTGDGEKTQVPFVVSLFNETVFVAFWLDLNRDGNAEDYGDAKYLREKYGSNVCEISKLIRE